MCLISNNIVNIIFHKKTDAFSVMLNHVDVQNVRSSLRESGWRHGAQMQNAINIKFRSKSWAAFGCVCVFLSFVSFV